MVVRIWRNPIRKENDMGKIVFFSLLFLSILLAIPLSYLYFALKQSVNKETVVETKTKKPKGGGWFRGVRDYLDIMSAFVPTFVVLLIILGLFWASILYRDRTNIPYENQMTEESQVERPVTQKRRAQRDGIVSWHKQEDYTGIGSRQSDWQKDAVLYRNDEEVMYFAAINVAGGDVHFKWNKRDKYGNWYQENHPENNGRWYLEPKASDQGDESFEGGVADGNGPFAQLNLKIG